MSTPFSTGFATGFEGLDTASVITAATHGLEAGDRFKFANVSPTDSGVSESQVYYVLALDLTADTFKFSETDGGIPFTLTNPITDGTITTAETYEVVSDGVMDAPTTPTAPDVPPTLDSIEVAGLIRLRIEVPSYEDTAVRVRSTEVLLTHEYDGATPVWEKALSLVFPKGTTTMSVPALGSTLYAAKSRVLDVYGNYSDPSSVFEHTTTPGADSRGIIDGAVTTAKLGDGAVTADKIYANSITAEKLASTIVLASLITTAETGRRMEVDVDGIRIYDASDALLVRLPTDGTANYFKGEVNADSLISQTSATLRTAVSLESGAVFTAQSGVTPPTNVPTLTASVDYLPLTTAPSNVSTAAGICFDSAGDDSFWIGCDPTISPYYVAQEFNASTGALIRSIPATGSTTTYTTTLGSTSHVSDTAQAKSGSTDSHIATPLTMPRAGTITKVSAYLAGYGGDAVCVNALWNDVSGTGNYVARSSGYTATSKSFVNGNSVQYNKDLITPYPIASGATIYAGFYHYSSGDGFQFDRDDGSGKTTYSGDGSGTTEPTDFDGTGWGVLNSASKPNVYVTYTYTVDTRVESFPIIGVAVDASYIYCLDTNGVIYKYDIGTMAYVAESGPLTISGTASKCGMFYDATAAALCVTMASGTGSGVYPKVVQIDPATLAANGTVYTAATGPTFTGTTDTFRGGARLADPLNANAATYWLATTSAVYAYTFSGSALTNTANRDFAQATTAGDGLTHDGTQFRGWDTSSPTKVWQFTNWDWTSASAVYWVGYSWYDPDGTTHETDCGPRGNITMKRRQRLQVTTAAIPGGGGADDPDNCRVYMLPGAADWAATEGKLQVTDALTSRYLTTYDSGGAADGGGTAFEGTGVASIESGGTGWKLRGSGLIYRTGTAFPTGMVTGDQFWRSDLNMEFFYNGTRWLSTQVFALDLGSMYSGVSYSASQGFAAFGHPQLLGGSDLWLEDFSIGFIVNSGGTALGASHKWTVAIFGMQDAGTASTTLSTIDIASGSSAVYRLSKNDVDALYNNGTVHDVVRFSVTKTGTPGTLNVGASLTYRVVAT